MILRSCTTKLVTVALTLVSVGLGATKAISQTIYPFSGNYDTAIDIVPLGQDISQSIELATSSNAPYGLTQYKGLIYAQTDPATGGLRFDTNPATFGLPNLRMGDIVFEGEDSDNKLRGTATAAVTFDRKNLTGGGSGTLTITGGEGLFAGATGTLAFSEVDELSPDPNALSLNGKALVTGSIQTVPEPEAGIGALVSTSAIGVGFLLRRYRKHSTTIYVPLLKKARACLRTVLPWEKEL